MAQRCAILSDGFAARRTPLVLVVAVLYGIWRVIKENRPRAAITGDGSDGTSTSGGGSTMPV